MPDIEFKARIPSFRLRPPNVRPDEGGPRLTIIFDADSDQDGLDLNALRDRVTTQDKKEVRVLLSWTEDTERLKQEPLRGMVKCGPGRRKGTWQCTDRPGENLLSPCQHTRTQDEDADNPLTPPAPQPDPPPTDKRTVVFCWSPSHPTAAHVETFACIDPYKPEPGTEYEIYTSDADDATKQQPAPALNPAACFYDPNAEGWHCRLLPELNSAIPCGHITLEQGNWAAAAGWVEPDHREARIQHEADKIAADLDRIEDADRKAEARRDGPSTNAQKPKRGRAKEPATA